MYCGTTNCRQVERLKYHWLVVEGETLQLPESVGGGGKFFEDDKSLSPHLHGLQGHNVNNLTKLGEESVERSLQLCRGRGAESGSPSHTIPQCALMPSVYLRCHTPSFLTLSLTLLM